jgi:hypothetical protein
LENVFFHPEEVGFMYDDENTLNKLDIDEKQSFIKLLSSYA